MVPETVIIILPLPPRILSPNCPIASIRGRFMKAAAAKHQRKLTMEAIQEEEVRTLPWRKVEVLPTFLYKVKRKRDSDNAIGSLKAAYDGIVDSGLVADDDPAHMHRLEPIFLVDKENPRVVLFITKVR